MLDIIIFNMFNSVLCFIVQAAPKKQTRVGKKITTQYPDLTLHEMIIYTVRKMV